MNNHNNMPNRSVKYLHVNSLGGRRSFFLVVIVDHWNQHFNLINIFPLTIDSLITHLREWKRVWNHCVCFKKITISRCLSIVQEMKDHFLNLVNLFFVLMKFIISITCRCLYRCLKVPDIIWKTTVIYYKRKIVSLNLGF